MNASDERKNESPTPRSPRETTSLISKANKSCCLSITAIMIGLIVLSIGVSSLFKDSATYLHSKPGSGVIITVGALIAFIGFVFLIRDRKLSNAVDDANRTYASIISNAQQSGDDSDDSFSLKDAAIVRIATIHSRQP